MRMKNLLRSQYNYYYILLHQLRFQAFNEDRKEERQGRIKEMIEHDDEDARSQ